MDYSEISKTFMKSTNRTVKSRRLFYNESMRKIYYFICLIFLICMNCSLSLAQNCAETPVRIEHQTIYSENLYKDLLFDVYVPPCLDERIIGGYPVVYLLHGQSMGIEVWEEMGMDLIIRDVLNQTDTPLFLTVVPQEDEYLLSMALSGYEEALLDELMPWIDTHYNTCKERGCRSIGGLSRGALWAEKIAFDHPDLFSSIGLLSMPGTFTDEHSLYFMAEKQEEDQKFRIRMDTGYDDRYRHDGSEAAAQLTFIGYSYEYNIEPGSHDEDYWQSQLADYFIWFSKSWKDAQSFSAITQTAE